MTNEELKAVLVEVAGLVAIDGATTETILHRVTSAARVLIETRKETLATCAGVCGGRQFKESEMVLGCCAPCVTRWFNEREMTIADFRKLPLLG